MRPSAELLEALFENAPRFTERLSGEDVASYDELIDRAEQIATRMPEADQLELIDGHPRIGAHPMTVSAASFKEQGYDKRSSPSDVALAERLEKLNDEYERRFGFRFCVFVAGRTRSEIADDMESRLNATRQQELARALSDVFAIARSRLATLAQPAEEAR
jgi:2-oxo-4-hydroxy-4-carboxy--5-ureidoimidazoline (OHCU) decarboxylase